jgi:hypothetical protein
MSLRQQIISRYGPIYYNAIHIDRDFPRIIKWHNEQLAKTATLSIIGITQEAML